MPGEVHLEMMKIGHADDPNLGLNTLKSRWIDDKEAFAMMSPDGFRLLASQGFAMREVARDSRRIIVSKP